MKDLSDKVVVVTGAASGIGLGITRALLAAGCRVAMLDVEDAVLRQAHAALGVEDAARPFVCDVTDRDAMATTGSRVRDHFGAVHIVCNNAGVAVAGPVADATHDDWDWVLGVNLHGVINGLRTYLPVLLANDEGGHIVNIASIYGVTTRAHRAVYAASKHAVVALSEVAREELAPQGIGVTVVCPDGVDTGILRARRNRPAELSETGDLLATRAAEAEQRLARKGLDPDHVGERVVRAIERNEAYVFTHPGSKEHIEARYRRLLDAFDGDELA